MDYVLVLRWQESELHWQSLRKGNPLDSEQVDGVRFIFRIEHHMGERTALAAIAKDILATDDWLVVERNEWIVDCDKLREKVPDRGSELDWLRGRLRVEPEVRHPGDRGGFIHVNDANTTSVRLTIYRTDLEHAVVADPDRRRRIFDDRSFHHGVAFSAAKSFVEGNFDDAIRRAMLTFYEEGVGSANGFRVTSKLS